MKFPTQKTAKIIAIVLLLSFVFLQILIADVEDLTSSTMITFIWIFTEEEVPYPNGLVWKIARNQFLKFLKEKYQHQNTFLSKLPDSTFGEDEETLSKFYRKDLHKKLEQVIQQAKNFLKAEEFYLIEEVYLNQRQPITTAKEMNLKPATLRQHLKRATDKMRHLWKQIF